EYRSWQAERLVLTGSKASGSRSRTGTARNSGTWVPPRRSLPITGRLRHRQEAIGAVITRDPPAEFAMTGPPHLRAKRSKLPRIRRKQAAARRSRERRSASLDGGRTGKARVVLKARIRA